MRVGIGAALALPDRPNVVVVLSDGYTPWPDEMPSCRLIASLVGEDPPTPPPWVETVRVVASDLT
ncbi:hypothetical protein AW27_033110 [Streptomyces sp. PCS3-D2]|uniref:hypothetical protein n=1 Tax=Streptomyces sp. PCS3-D2 TaxID=1460244 RepID=UPI00044C06CB|nr:hypothetical protein [Streptomyces sp. PCS3-D2]WKV75938.1 hypothetical protein AW27_033110 [Streptomyces sp. PCS3-D2]